MLEHALSILEEYYGQHHFQIANTLADLANTYGVIGDACQQKTMLERALVIQEKHYGLDHPIVAKMLVSLATAYGTFGDAKQKKYCWSEL